MAIKGAYDYKGIAISDAYVKITSVNWSCNSNQVTSEKTPAVYNSDGSIKTEAVMETIIALVSIKIRQQGMQIQIILSLVLVVVLQ